MALLSFLLLLSDHQVDLVILISVQGQAQFLVVFLQLFLVMCSYIGDKLVLILLLLVIPTFMFIFQIDLQISALCHLP